MGQNFAQLKLEFRFVIGFKKKSASSILDGLGAAADLAGQDGEARRHRFQERIR
jgi:hypothetical protein